MGKECKEKVILNKNLLLVKQIGEEKGKPSNISPFLVIVNNS